MFTVFTASHILSHVLVTICRRISHNLSQNQSQFVAESVTICRSFVSRKSDPIFLNKDKYIKRNDPPLRGDLFFLFFR
jgi:hypothetical protein